MLRPKIVGALAALDEAANKGEQLASSLAGDIDRIGNTSAGSTSQRLFATLGAGTGAVGAIALTLVSAVPFVVAAPVFIAVGGALGALSWRGTKGIRAERDLHYREMLLAKIRKEIESIQTIAPPEVLEDLWEEYRFTATGYGRESLARLQPPKADPPPKMLPSPKPDAQNGSL